MNRLRARLIILTLSLLSVAIAPAQGPDHADQAVQQLTMDLCGCMASIEPKSTDVQFEQAVHRCLEDAVVHHPAAVRLLLQQGAAENKGYRIGLLLGRALDHRCPAFEHVKLRLQHIEAGRALLRKPS